jgi:hypothetical protein
MRWSKLLLVVLAVVAVAGPVSAQVIGCADLDKSLNDSIKTVFTTGKPGDTVLIPLQMKNPSYATAFQLLIQFDTSKLTPVFIRDSVCDSIDASTQQCVRYAVDSSYIDRVVAGRFVILDSTDVGFGWVWDTITNFNINLFQQKKNVLACTFLPSLLRRDSLPPGTDVIFYVKFKVHPNLAHLTTAPFTYFESNIFTIDSTQFPPVTTYYPGCWESQMSLVGNVQVYPSHPVTTYFRADTNSVPTPAITLTADPTSGSSGVISILSWTAVNTDSVVITASPPLTPDFHKKFTGLEGSISTGQLTSTTTFTGVGYKGSSKTDTAQATVTIGGIGPGPTVTFTPSIQAYTINQGETVSFQVKATGTTGQTVTLSAGTPPNNATFAPTNPVVGTTSVTGTFSFTPDFNQQGGFSISFTGSTSSGTTTQSVLISVNQLQKDRLFSTSAAKQKPVGGLRGTPGIKFPINLISSKTVYGVQFDMDYPSNFVAIDSFTVSNRILDYVVYDNLGEIPGTVRVTTFGLQNDSVKTDVSSAILYAYMTLDSNAVPWTSYPINMRNGRESVNPDPNVGTLELQTDSGVVECDKPGDVNLDKFIDVGDLVNIVSSIIGTFTLTPRQFATADLITDAAVNVFDLVADINLIYGRPISPAPGQPVPGPQATIGLAYGDMSSGSADLLTVRSELPEQVAGVQMDIAYDPNSVVLGIPHITRDDKNFVLQYKDFGNGKMRVLLHHPSGTRSELLQAGAADLVTIPITAKADIRAGDKTKLRITQALLATPTAASIAVSGVDQTLPANFMLAQNYPNPFNPITTIEFSLGYFEDGSAVKHVNLEIYNVLGQLVKSLVDADRSPGSYREEWDATNLGGQRVSSGVYLYRLQVGNENQTKKMLLLK